MAKLPLFTALQTKADAGFSWFVYGSSLDFSAFGEWCGQHGYVLPDLTTAQPAVLPGWRLAFNVRSNFWGGVVASLVEDATSHVEGILLPLPAEAMGFVRHKEGVVSGLFEERRGACDVGGASQSCVFFVAAPGRTVPEEAPAARFLDVLVKGSKDRGLSASWIASLESRRE